MHWHLFWVVATNTQRFEARELLHIMTGTHWAVSEHERQQIEAHAYPWETRDGPAFVQTNGGIWVPGQ